MIVFKTSFPLHSFPSLSFNYKFSIKIFMNCSFINEWMVIYFITFFFNLLDMQNTITIVFNKNIEEKKFQFVAELKWNTWQLLFIYYMYVCIYFAFNTYNFLFVITCPIVPKKENPKWHHITISLDSCWNVNMYGCINVLYMYLYPLTLYYFIFCFCCCWETL